MITKKALRKARILACGKLRNKKGAKAKVIAIT